MVASFDHSGKVTTDFSSAAGFGQQSVPSAFFTDGLQANNETASNKINNFVNSFLMIISI
jgi:hypothetical protein